MGKADLTLGQIAVQLGYITPAQLSEALEEQSKSKKPIGMVLVLKKFITDIDLERLLAIQRGGISQVLDKEGKTLYVCMGCGTKYKIKDANLKKKYLCRRCKAVLVADTKPQSIADAQTERLEFASEDDMVR